MRAERQAERQGGASRERWPRFARGGLAMEPKSMKTRVPEGEGVDTEKLLSL